MSRTARATAAAGPHLARAALVAALAMSVGVFHVWARTRVLSAGYALGGLQNDHVKLESEHDRLRIEVETLRSPAAVERFARTRLGMAPPEPGAVSAAGPLLAGAGRADGVGVGHLTGPAEPSRSTSVRHAPPGGTRLALAVTRGTAPFGSRDPAGAPGSAVPPADGHGPSASTGQGGRRPASPGDGERDRGPLRAGRAPRGR